MLQEVELLIKRLLPTVGEGDGELERPRTQRLLKGTRPLSEPIRKSPSISQAFFTGHTRDLSCPLGLAAGTTHWERSLLRNPCDQGSSEKP